MNALRVWVAHNEMHDYGISSALTMYISQFHLVIDKFYFSTDLNH